jgi:hypothetical protein
MAAMGPTVYHYPWYGMHPKFADTYFTALAEATARRAGLRPLTDDPLSHVAVSGFDVDRLACVLLPIGTRATEKMDVKDRELEQRMVTIAFENVVPENLEDLSVSELLAFRDKTVEERTQFQDAVSDMVSNLGYLTEVSDPKAAAARLEAEFRRRLKPPLDRLEKSMTRNNLKQGSA